MTYTCYPKIILPELACKAFTRVRRELLRLLFHAFFNARRDILGWRLEDATHTPEFRLLECLEPHCRPRGIEAYLLFVGTHGEQFFGVIIDSLWSPYSSRGNQRTAAGLFLPC